jgi:hypothetical protein
MHEGSEWLVLGKDTPGMASCIGCASGSSSSLVCTQQAKAWAGRWLQLRCAYYTPVGRRRPRMGQVSMLPRTNSLNQRVTFMDKIHECVGTIALIDTVAYCGMSLLTWVIEHRMPDSVQCMP